MENIATNKGKNLFLNILKGAIVSISITLVLILIFALIVRFFNVPDGYIFPINQVIKMFSICFGLLAMLKNERERGFLKGILLGITYFVLSFLLFSILQKSFSFSMKNVYDLLLTALMSGLLGIILVNIKK